MCNIINKSAPEPVPALSCLFSLFAVFQPLFQTQYDLRQRRKIRAALAKKFCKRIKAKFSPPLTGDFLCIFEFLKERKGRETKKWLFFG